MSSLANAAALQPDRIARASGISSSAQVMERRALEYVVEFVRLDDSEDPNAPPAGFQPYLMTIRSGERGWSKHEEISVDWEDPLWQDGLRTLERSALLGQDIGLDELQQRMGDRLREMLDSAGWDRYDDEIGEAVRTGRQVYLTLCSEAAEIYTLPWELVTVESSGQALFTLPGVFLGYTWPEVTIPPRRDDAGDQVLLACSTAGGMVPAKEHSQALEASCAGAVFEPSRDIVKHVSRTSLSAALQRAADDGRPVSALHILCHGGREGETYGLWWDGPDGGKELVTARDLRRVLTPHVAHLRLVVLAACGGAGDAYLGTHLGGLAQGLHRIGVEWVIGARYPLTTAGSNMFCEVFFDKLFAAYLPLEEALAAARAELFARGGPIDGISVQLFARPESRIKGAQGPRPTVGALWHVADEPMHYLPRRSLCSRVIAALVRDDSDHKHGLYGMGGVGKSVTAAAVARSELIRERFRDGVYWLSLGQNPDLLRLQRQLAAALGIHTDFDHPGDGERHLAEALAGKQVLIILDDVWESSHVAAFDIVGSTGRVLLTTRNREVLTHHNADSYSVALLTVYQARKLLSQWTDDDELPAEADAIIQTCGHLPVALAMVGALVGGGIHSWSRVQSWLDRALLKKVKGRLNEYERYHNVYQVIGASVTALTEDPSMDISADIETCYAELAVFADREAIARAELLLLWGLRGLDDADVDELADALVARALATREASESDDPDDYALRLHDLQMMYARACVTDLAALHGRFIDACAAAEHGNYFFLRRGYHLVEAGRADELRSLLWDYDWLVAKLRAVGPGELLADFDLLATAPAALHAGDAELALVRDGLRLSSHVLADDPEQLPGQLVGRLRRAAAKPERPALRTLLAEIRQRTEAPWCEPMGGALTPPGGPLMRTLDATRNVSAVALSGDARYAASVSYGRKAKLWDLQRGIVLDTLEGHTGWINAIAFVTGANPGETRVVTASDDGTVKLWSAATGAVLRTLGGHEGPVNSLAVTTDGCCAVAASGATLTVWNLRTGERLQTLAGHAEDITAVALAPDGRYALSASADHVLNLWDPQTGEKLATIRALADALAISPDGRLAVAASSDRVIEVWNLTSKQLHQTLHGHMAQVNAVTFTHGGECVLSASNDGTLELWEPDSGVRVRTLRGHSDEVTTMSVANDGRIALSGSRDRTLKVWDLHAPADPAAEQAHTGTVTALAVSDDGTAAISVAEDGRLKVWDVRTAVLARTVERRSRSLHALAVTGNCTRAVTGAYGDLLQTWEIPTGNRIHAFHGHSIWIQDLAMTRDGALAVSAGSNGTARVWDMATGEQLFSFTGHDKPIDCVALTPDDRYAVTGSRDRTVQVWDIRTGEVQTKLSSPLGFVCAIRVSADGHRVVAAERRGVVRSWDLCTGSSRYEFHTVRGLRGMALLPDGRHVVLGADDRTLSVWRLDDGRRVATYTADQPIHSCAVATAAPESDDADMLLAGDAAGSVHFLVLRGLPRK